jgi:protein-L-isoaspartate(D-aspartate) O-methyltransferase
VIDRKFFLNYELQRDESENLRSIMIAAAGGNLNPYADTPKPIGWNTTISAPSMHAETLKNLYEHLVTAKSILDIGTGSGFLTAAMAYIAPQNATVYAVDHI